MVVLVVGRQDYGQAAGSFDGVGISPPELVPAGAFL
jgi:hypothetical protein